MGNTPAQMVMSGMAMNTGAVMAPTTYDHTPKQYMMRISTGSSFWNSGQCSTDSTIWKWPCREGGQLLISRKTTDTCPAALSSWHAPHPRLGRELVCC